MAFSEKIKKEIETYCNNHLATDLWYENEFYFIANFPFFSYSHPVIS